MWFTEMANVLKREFDPQGYDVTTRELPKWVASIGSIFMSELKSVMEEWGIELLLDNKKSREILGIEYRPIEKSITEMVYSMWETGALQDKRKIKKAK